MRKKSHILLARYIAKNTEDEELKKHRLSFLYWQHSAGLQTIFCI